MSLDILLARSEFIFTHKKTLISYFHLKIQSAVFFIPMLKNTHQVYLSYIGDRTSLYWGRGIFRHWLLMRIGQTVFRQSMCFVCNLV